MKSRTENTTMYRLDLAVVVAIVFAMASCVSLKPKPKPQPLSKTELRILKKMGGRVLKDGNIAIGKIKIDRVEKEVIFDATVSVVDTPIEVLIATPRGRTYESFLSADVDPMNLQLALVLTGAVNGARKPPAEGDKGPKMGDVFDVDVIAKGERKPIEAYLVDSKNGKPIPREGWVFVGSKYNYGGKCLARDQGNVILSWSFGNTILDNPSDNGDTDDNINVRGDLKNLKVGDQVTIVLRKRPEKSKNR